MRYLHSNNRKTCFPLLFTILLEPKLMVKYTMVNFLFVAAAVMVFCYMLMNYMLAHKMPSKMFLAVVVWRLSFAIQTFVNHGDITMWGYFSIITVTLCMVFDYYMPIDPVGLVRGLTQVLTAYLVINLFTVILWPNGIIDGMYFVGIRTRFTELVAAAMVFSVVLDQQLGRKFSLRTAFVLAVSAASILIEWVAAAIIGIALGVITYFLLLRSQVFARALTLARALMVSLAVNIGVVIFNVQQYLSWVFVDLLGKDVNLTYRTELWALALVQIAKRPIFGYGQCVDGTFIQWWRSMRLWQAHNQWLQLLHDGGIICVLCFIAIIVLCSHELRKARDSHAAKPVLAGIIAFLIMMIVEIYSYTPYLFLILFLACNVRSGKTDPMAIETAGELAI